MNVLYNRPAGDDEVVWMFDTRFVSEILTDVSHLDEAEIAKLRTNQHFSFVGENGEIQEPVVPKRRGRPPKVQ